MANGSSSSKAGKGGSKDQRDALAYIQDQLATYGIGTPEFAQKVWDFMVSTGTDDPNQIMLWLYEQPEFKQRFPAIEARRAAGLNAITPAQYLEYENQAHQLMRAAGMPPGFYDGNDDYTAFLVADVSIAELGARVEEGWARVSSAPLEVRQEFARYFGAEGDNALAAYFLDPERALPVLQGRVAQAEIAGAGAMYGVGGLSQVLAQQIAGRGVGFTDALQGFDQLSQLAIFNETLGEARGAGGAAVAGQVPQWAIDRIQAYEQSVATWDAEWAKLAADPNINVDDPQVATWLRGTLANRGIVQPGSRPDDAYAAASSSYGAIGSSGPGDLRREVEGVQSVFGLDPAVRDRVQRRLAQRAASLAGGGGAYQDRQGVVGLGTAR